MTLEDAKLLDSLLSEVSEENRFINKKIENKDTHTKIAELSRFLSSKGFVRINSLRYPNIFFAVLDPGIAFKSTNRFEQLFTEQLKSEQRAKLQEEANLTQIEANKISVKAYRMSKIAIGISIISVIASVLVAKFF